MMLKWFVVTSALLAGFGVATAHAQTRAAQGAPAAPSGLTVTPTAAASPATTSTAATTPMPSGATAPVGGYPLSTDYVIGPEDLLMITVWKNDALSRTLPVRPDGKISLPLLYDVQAAGLTAM
jgi:polysaccharide export outer membrane protein